MNSIRFLLASILLIAVIGGCASVKETRKKAVILPPGTLNATEVTALFSGKTVRSVLDKNGRISLTYYNPGGEIVQTREGRKRSGIWWVRKDGRICLQFEGAKSRCRIITKEGPVYRKYIVKRDGNHRRIITYTSFTDGNLIE
ncbi:MAG: hypothetical protein WBB19_20550 [Desulforhopalus sp.]